jgi:ribose transport system substrate-binding protein
MQILRSSFSRLGRIAAAALLSAALSAPAVVAGTFMEQCYKPGANNTGTLKSAAKKGPFRIAVVNGHTGIPWREQMIKSVKAWAARPENAADIAELKIVSTGSDVAMQIAAIDNFIQSGYDAIAFIAVNPQSGVALTACSN